MSIELKPCPFCGGEAALSTVRTLYSVGHETVQCTKCLAFCGPQDFDAVKHWNTRAAPPVQPDEWPADLPDKALTQYISTGNGGNPVFETASWFADIKRAFFAGFSARDDWQPPVRESGELEVLKIKVRALYGAIAHGDDKHKAWLHDAINTHFAGHI